MAEADVERLDPSAVMWSVGDPDDWDGFSFAMRALDEDGARAAYMAAHAVGYDMANAEECAAWADRWSRLDVQRQEAWDTLDKVRSLDWLAAGFGASCAECDEMVFTEDGFEVINGRVVCEECALARLRLADGSGLGDGGDRGHG